MAKTTAPILSFDGAGTIGKTVTFSKWRGVKYARQRVVPANPNTAEQQLTRTTFALLREMWKLAPQLARDPWTAFAAGRPFTGDNKFVGENVRVLRGEALMTAFIGSPGARGGLTPVSMAGVAGGASGEIDVTFVTPTPPTGWTLTKAVAMAFNDQDPSAFFTGPLVAGEDATAPYEITLAGLGSAVSCIVAGWLVWTKPNGQLAYSVGITDTVTSAA